MYNILNPLEIALMTTGHNQKYLVFIVPDQKDSLPLLELFNDYSISWRDDGQLGYRIRIMFNIIGEVIWIKLTQELSDYPNIDWLLNYKINCLAVGYKDELGRTHFLEPFALNYQGAQ